MKRGANKQTNSFLGNVNAVDCSDCKVDASNLMVAMLGVKGVSITAGGNLAENRHDVYRFVRSVHLHWAGGDICVRALLDGDDEQTGDRLRLSVHKSWVRRGRVAFVHAVRRVAERLAHCRRVADRRRRDGCKSGGEVNMVGDGYAC